MRIDGAPRLFLRKKGDEYQALRILLRDCPTVGEEFELTCRRFRLICEIPLSSLWRDRVRVLGGMLVFDS